MVREALDSHFEEGAALAAGESFEWFCDNCTTWLLQPLASVLKDRGESDPPTRRLVKALSRRCLVPAGLHRALSAWVRRHPSHDLMKRLPPPTQVLPFADEQEPQFWQ